LPGLLAGRPIAWRDGVAAACSSGAIVWLDPQSGRFKADALQLRLGPGMRLSDCRLTSGGKDGAELLVADSRGILTRIGLATEPEPHLAELASVKLPSPATGLVATETAVGLVDRRGQWQSFSLPDLVPASAPALAARAFVAGPVRIGQHQLVATDRDELVCFGGTLDQVWRVPLPHGPLAGEPVADSSGVLLATQSGWLCRLALDSGQELAHMDLGQPLAGSPLVAGEFAIVPAADGTLLKVALSALEGVQP
jgi:hypothetical protein